MDEVSIKPPKTFEEQVELLRGRGLIIEDENRAIECLKRINYYRLTAYTLTFSGRAKDDVIAGLKLLEQEQYIELDDMGQVRKLLEAWERPGIPYQRR